MTTGTTTLTATVRFFAAARAAAGTETTSVELPEGASVEDLLDTLRAGRDAEFARVLQRCSYLLDEIAVRDTSVVVPHGAVLDVLPPFAGG
ncbi:MoaD/ThiS family protein [Pseudonocardia benzenivorans]|uniref:ThiamineS protein n=2 Tax=Pseudonocardia TaxID=1847 RepID=F4CZW3_PSEUX|nr:MoaD/ThiS family protein [Pseudonocardia dioxanivorans]AEA27789.1 thiamineS protein [Pseudonocardia dioxanivorans CB1190]GJF05396.1 molybdopterin synthase sulfur carrier subunit [Pseudonocardia sp. D17]